MASTAEMAWNQGDDLYGFANNRFMYVAKYNNRDDNVPLATYEWGTGINGDVRWQTEIPKSGRCGARPVWEMIYNHYANRKGLSVPNIDALAQLLRPEGDPNNTHPSTFDQPGFGTLLYTRPAGSDVTATLSDGNIPYGTYRFIVLHTGKVMDAAGTSNGANILQWSYHGGTNQQWNVTHLDGGQYSIKNVQSGLTLDVANASLDHGAPNFNCGTIMAETIRYLLLSL